MHLCRHSSASTQSRKWDTTPPPPFPPPPVPGTEALVTVRVLEALLLLLEESGWRADTVASARNAPGADGRQPLIRPSRRQDLEFSRSSVDAAGREVAPANFASLLFALLSVHVSR